MSNISEVYVTLNIPLSELAARIERQLTARVANFGPPPSHPEELGHWLHDAAEDAARNLAQASLFTDVEDLPW